jgi:hypothetical protein
MRRAMQFGIVTAVLFAVGAAPAWAVLPKAIEGLQNPHVIFGVSYLQDDPGPAGQRWNSILTANLPLLSLPFIPKLTCAAFGVGLTGAGLGPPFDQFELGASLPILTCAANEESRFVGQVGFTVKVVGDEHPTGYYAGLGFRLDSSATLAAKRKAEHEARERQELNRRLAALP